MTERGKPAPRSPLSLRHDRRGLAAVETAFIMLPFLTLLFLIIELGIYFSMQSALDAGLLTTAEGLRSNLAASSTSSLPAAAALKTTISTNGGTLLSFSTLAVDVRQLSTLSAGAVAIADGTIESSVPGDVLVVRAQMTMPFVPGTTMATMTSTSIVRRPLY